MDIPKLNDWLKNRTIPSGRLFNILAHICLEEDISPEEINKDRFMAVKGAGPIMWGEFISIKRGINLMSLYRPKKTKKRYPELQRGQLWTVEGEIYELYDLRVTGATYLKGGSARIS